MFTSCSKRWVLKGTCDRNTQCLQQDHHEKMGEHMSKFGAICPLADLVSLLTGLPLLPRPASVTVAVLKGTCVLPPGISHGEKGFLRAQTEGCFWSLYGEKEAHPSILHPEPRMCGAEIIIVSFLWWKESRLLLHKSQAFSWQWLQRIWKCWNWIYSQFQHHLCERINQQWNFAGENVLQN